MITILPIDFIESQGLVTSTNLGTDSTVEWTSVAVSIGDLRKVTTTSNGASSATYKIYEALTAIGLTDPTTDVGTVSPGIGTDWKEVGSVNEWAWANNVLADQATGSGLTIEIELTPAQVINGIGFANVDCELINVEIVDPTDGTVFDEDYDMTSYVGIDSFYDWLFEPIVRSRKLAIFNIPPYPSAVVTITLSVSSGSPSVGAIIAGRQFIVGDSLYGTRFSFDDYSKIEYIPDLGRTIVSERDYSDEVRAQVYVEDARLESVRDYIASLRNVTTVWMADTNDTGTIVFGLLREMVVVLREHNGTFLDLEVGGST